VLDQSTCADGYACHWASNGKTGQCGLEGAAGEGDPCSSQSHCAAGLICIGSPATFCRVLCDYENFPNQQDPNFCVVGQSCRLVDQIIGWCGS
jgi:hypothetical protein